MKIAFRKKSSGILPWLVRWWTKSPYSHCEIVFTNGLTFSADVEVFKTRFKCVEHNSDEWDIIKIPINKIAEYKIYDFCLEEDNCFYDFLGILFSQILSLSFENPWWWYCSENVASCLHKLNICTDVIPHQTNPGSLYKILKERFPE